MTAGRTDLRVTLPSEDFDSVKAGETPARGVRTEKLGGLPGPKRHPDDCLIGFFGRLVPLPREFVFVRTEGLHPYVVGRYGPAICRSGGRTGKGLPFQDRC